MSIDIEKAAKRINTYWTGSKSCPICTHDDWVIMERAWMLMEYKGGGVTIGGPILPLVAMMCNVCGHTIFFNALAVGAVIQEDEQEEKNE